MASALSRACLKPITVATIVIGYSLLFGAFVHFSLGDSLTRNQQVMHETNALHKQVYEAIRNWGKERLEILSSIQNLSKQSQELTEQLQNMRKYMEEYHQLEYAQKSILSDLQIRVRYLERRIEDGEGK